MYICTTGIGQLDDRARRSPAALIEPGDRILVSGSIGEHGTAIMLARGEFELDAEVELRHPLAVAGRRRAARGGRSTRCAACATRPAAASPRCSTSWPGPRGVAIVVREGDVPVRPAVAGAAELLGIDPMYIANEGKFVAFVAPDAAERCRSAALRASAGLRGGGGDRRGEGRAAGNGAGGDAFGGTRVMDLLAGDPLPRIC